MPLDRMPNWPRPSSAEAREPSLPLAESIQAHQRIIAQLECLNEQMATAIERIIAQGFVDRDKHPETHARLSALLVLVRGEP